jgi:hypothetical protein
VRLGALACALLLAACNAARRIHAEAPDDAAVCQLYRDRTERAEAIAGGTVAAILGTRRGPSGTHEGFLLHLDGGCALTLRIETNTDLTGPVPLQRGERVVVKGEYVYDPRGGLIHWTHRDPRGRHAGGYVVAGGRTYE